MIFDVSKARMAERRRPARFPSACHSNWLDNTRARFDLKWRPRTDLAKLIDTAWDFKRAKEEAE